MTNFILVDIAWVFFRADSVKVAIEILKASLYLSGVESILSGSLFFLGLSKIHMMILVIAMLILLFVSFMQNNGTNMLEWLTGQNLFFRYVVYWIALLLIIFSLNITGQEFIYFQF